MQQTFPAGKESKIIIKQLNGDLSARAWEQPLISIETDGSVTQVTQEGDIVMIVNCDDDLALHVPPDTEIHVTNAKGDLSLTNLRRVELKNIAGDVVLDTIGVGADIEQIGEAIAVAELSGDLLVNNASSLRGREEVQGDVTLTNVALIEMENVGGDLALKQTEAVVIGAVGGDMTIEGIADALSCGNVGGDCQIKGSTQAELTIGNVGGDLLIESALNARFGAIGGDCVLRNVSKTVEIGNIGSDARFSEIGGNVQAGNIGGDASLSALQGSLDVGNIGGDLALEAAFPAGSTTRLHVGGDASVRLPAHPDLNVRAFVGGDISGSTIASGKNGNWINLAYGNGAAQLELHVGGDLNLRGGDQPRNSSSSGGWGTNFASEFAGEMAELGRLGEEIGREIRSSFKDANRAGSNWSDSLTKKINEQMRRAQHKAEEQARKAEERARKTEMKNPRVRVRFNEREWQLDPERLERIKEQASKAASEGISSAMEAVERAISNLRMAPPSRPSKPPTPAQPPVPPKPPVPPTPGQPAQYVQAEPSALAQNDPAPQAVETPGDAAPDLDQEREAILRMIAEGRLSPEEGDLMLEGLGG